MYLNSVSFIRLGSKKDVLLHSESCRSCTNSYLVEPVGVFRPFDVGDLYAFTSDGHDLSLSKDFAIRALVSSGKPIDYHSDRVILIIFF